MPEPLRREADPAPYQERQPLRLNASDRRRVVVRYLRQLPPRDRQMLALSYFEDLDADDVAGVTGQPAGEVRSRLRRLLDGVEAALLAEDDALWRQLGRGRARG